MTLKICPNGLILLKHFTLQSKARNIVNDLQRKLIEKSLSESIFKIKNSFGNWMNIQGLDKFGFSCTVMFLVWAMGCGVDSTQPFDGY